MSAMPSPLDANVAQRELKAVPFATVHVRLTQQAHVGLLWDANYWKSAHHRATLRLHWAELEHRRELEQAGLREATLRGELEQAQAKIRDLQRRVFGRKSERGKGASEAPVSVSSAPRGQQRGAAGHGRTMQSHLPGRVEFAVKALN